MAKTQAEAKPQRVTAEGIFVGVFCVLIQRGWKSIYPYRNYSAACEAVYLEVKKICTETGQNCRFVIRCHPIHGDSQRALEILGATLTYGMTHLRVPGDGSYHFSIGPEQAKSTLEREMKSIDFDRAIYENLADIFAKVYNEGASHDND